MKNLLLFLLAISGSASNAQNSNLYFLSIGNGHYQSNGNYSNFLNDIPEAVGSAKAVANVLKHYGTGETLLSSAYDYPLYKKIILSKMADIFDRAFQDKKSTVFIYYCGHGVADESNNLYLVPGDVEKGISNLTTADFISSFIAVQDIERLYFEEFRQGKLDIGVDRSILNNFMSEVMKYGIMQNFITPFIKKPQQDKKYSDFIDNPDTRYIISKLPKVVVFLDCCYNKAFLDSNNRQSTELDLFKTITQKTLLDQAKGDESEETDNYGDDTPSVFSGFSNAFFNGQCKLFELSGSKIVYSAAKNQTITTVDYPNKNGSGMQVTPIARRILIFYKNNPIFFTPINLITKLTDKSFDSKTSPMLLRSNIAPSIENRQTTQIEDAKKLDYVIQIK